MWSASSNAGEGRAGATRHSLASGNVQRSVRTWRGRVQQPRVGGEERGGVSSVPGVSHLFGQRDPQHLSWDKFRRRRPGRSNTEESALGAGADRRSEVRGAGLVLGPGGCGRASGRGTPSPPRRPRGARCPSWPRGSGSGAQVAAARPGGRAAAGHLRGRPGPHRSLPARFLLRSAPR